tara:strand:+ start:364 stop:477 length:114 start_codon:yes stop_codon:yes gene_type:complete
LLRPQRLVFAFQIRISIVNLFNHISTLNHSADNFVEQ